MKTLAEYYTNLGYPPELWHLGDEHPAIENYAIQLAHRLPLARVLEIGVQSGGFAVPLILAMQDHPKFSYVGIDNGAYATAVDGSVISGYLAELNLNQGYEFLTVDSDTYLKTLPRQEFDLILVDHFKPLYPRDFETIARRQILSADGYLLFHDVLNKAAGVWKDCQKICAAFGYSWQIVSEVPSGLAVVRLNPVREHLEFWRTAKARLRFEISRLAIRLLAIDAV